jgi:AraC-like DNA-binding protein
MTAPSDGLADATKDREVRKKPGSKRGRRPGSALGPESGARAIAAARRQAAALQLRESGMDLREIAAELGYSDASGAYRAVRSALQTILPDETRDEYRRLEIARIDALQAAMWPRAIAGDAKAAGIVLRCVSTRSDLLGLEAPRQIDVHERTYDHVRVEIMDVLNDENLAAAERLRDEMFRLSELRAGTVVD